MGNLYDFCNDLFTKIVVVFNKIWSLLTTTLNDAVGNSSTGITWLDNIFQPFLNVIGDWNLINLFFTATIIIIIVRVVRTFFGG